MIAGEKCPICEKGALKETLDEVERGVKVEAFKCGKCGEIFYSQEIMERVEAMRKAKSEERSLVRIGNSLAAILPAQIVKKLGLKEKGKIFVEEDKGKITIRASVR